MRQEHRHPPEGSLGLPPSRGGSLTPRGECSGAPQSRPPEAHYGARGGGSGKSLGHEGGLPQGRPSEPGLGCPLAWAGPLGQLCLKAFGTPVVPPTIRAFHLGPARAPPVLLSRSAGSHQCSVPATSVAPRACLLLWPAASPQVSPGSGGRPVGPLPPSLVPPSSGLVRLVPRCFPPALCHGAGNGAPAMHGAHGPACDHGCSGVCRSVPHLRRALQPRGSCAELSPPWPVGWGECPFSVPPRMGVPVAFCGASLSSACLALQNPPASGRQTAPPATARGGLELSPDFIFMQRHGNRVQSKTRAQGSLPKARPC